MKFFLAPFILLVLLFSCKSSSDTSVSNNGDQAAVSIPAVQFDSIISNSNIQGQLQRYSAFPSEYVGEHIVDVWLPENYSETKKYAVVYMNDGQNLFDPAATKKNLEMMADETITELVAAGTIKETIVVGVHSNGRKRHDEYFPKKPFEALPQKDQDSLKKIAKAFNMEMKLSSDYYLKFLVDELKPFVDATYATQTDRANTFISGASMGGLISMYAVCEYPETFGGAICMSSHWPGVLPTDTNPIPPTFFEYMRNNLPVPGNNRFYFSSGTKGMDRFYVKFEDEVNQVFTEKGYTADNFINFRDEGGNHTEGYWNKRLPEGLQMMLQK